MKKTYLCPRCGKPMIKCNDDGFFEDDETMYEFVCHSCGMEYEMYVPNENQSFSEEIGNQGFGKCPVCGKYLLWNADFMKSEITGEELTDEEDTLVQELSCPVCGTRITAFYPLESFTTEKPAE